ncbi:hypothetical protein GCM10010271_45960 [Streptomyces kurssanovii]|nr:hypothetical protein GCM10010271_45960 [Streptomyces kurssanovii]
MVLAASAHDNAADTALLDQAAERCGMRLEKALVHQGFTAPPPGPRVRPPSRHLRPARLLGFHRQHGPPPHHIRPHLA